MQVATDSRREQILAAARRHFTEYGYEGTSMRQIAAEIGINIATLYFHCSTKEELFFDVLDTRRRRLWDGLQAALRNTASSPIARLSAAIAFHVECSCEPEAGPVVSAAHLRRLPGPLSEQYIQRRDEYEGQFRSLIQAGIETGDFAPVDVPLAAAGILAIGFSVAQWYRPGGRLSPNEIAASYVQQILQGFQPRQGAV